MLICLDMRTGAGCGSQTVNEALFCEHCGQNLRFALMLHDAGTVVGRYRVVRVIGYGGFGAIYEALGAAGEQVALKETFDTSSISTFKREFAVLSQLKHANLPRYMDMFEAEGNGYLVMEYVPGQSLQDVLDSQTELLPESQVLGYALQLCDVLDYLHSQKPPILHRDVKPANIRLTPEGRIKLVDFGLLKQGGYQTRATIRGLGTPAYAPIEQYAHNQKATNPRSDLYALGATLYHLLTAKEPPSAPNRLTNSETLPPLPVGLSPHLKEAIIKAMSVMPDDRFADMQTFKLALQRPEAVEEQLVTLMTNQDTAATVHETPVSPSTSTLNRVATWLTRTFIQTQSAYVMQNNEKGLPYLPLNATGKVLKVLFRSDGTQQSLIGMTNKGVIYQWRVPDGQLLKLLSLAVPPERDLEAIAYSPTGDTVATASKDYMIRIWQTQDGQLLHELRGHGGLVKALTYAPSGKVLLSTSYDDKLICFWHVATGKLLKKIDEGKQLISLAFSPSGLYLLGSSYGTSDVWRMGDDKLLRTINEGCHVTNGAQWDPTGKMLAYGHYKTLSLHDAITGKVIQEFQDEKGYFTGVAWHPDGQQIAAGAPEHQVQIFALDQNEPIYLCLAHEKKVLSVAYSPDARFLASGGEDQRVCLWAFDPASLPERTLIHKSPLEVVESPPLHQEPDPSTSSSFVWQQEKAKKRLSSYVDAAHQLDLPHLVCKAKGKVLKVLYHPDGQQLIGMTNAGKLYYWRLEDGKLIKTQRLVRGDKLTCVAISPDFQTVAGAGEDLIVRVWRLENGELLHELRQHSGEIRALAYTPDGQVLASSGGEDETILFWRVADGRLLRTLQAKKPTICLKFSPSGQYLACGSSYRVHIWRIRSQKWMPEIKKGCKSEEGISWSADETLLLCGYDNNVYLWRVRDGKGVKSFRGHHYTVKAVGWHPNGQLLLSAGADKTVRVWSPTLPHLQHVGEGHQDMIRCVVASPDGRTFATGSEDGTARIWLFENSAEEDSTTKRLEAPIQKQPIPVPSSIYLTKTASDVPPVRGPSTLRKIGGWMTKQLLQQTFSYVPAANQLSLPHLICKAEGEVLDIIFTPDQREVIGITAKGHLSRWSVQSGILHHTHLLSTEHKIQLAAIDPNEQTVATVTNDVMLDTWHGISGKHLHTLRGHTGTIKALAHHPQADYLASSSEHDKTVRLWHSTEGKLLRIFKPGRAVHSLAFNPKGHLLAGGSSFSIYIWNIYTGKLVRQIEHGCSQGQTLQWSQNEQQLLSAHYHNLHILRLTDGQSIQEFKGHSSNIRAVAYHPNGQLVGSAGYDYSVRIWSPTEPHLQYLCKEHQRTVNCLAFSANGTRLASGSQDETVRLWKF